MKLVTYQSIEALKDLLSNGYLECNPKYINQDKVGFVYNWLIKKMNEKIENKYNTVYPIWCWVKCYNCYSPIKRKGKPIDGFDVKITFNLDKKDVFITDFRRYSFLLNNMYIPNSKKDKEMFDSLLEEKNISRDELKALVRKDKYESCRNDENYLNICKKIEQSFDRCITEDSNILQGCVWRINLNDIESIDILKDDGYTYGSLNYVRENGKRFDWINDFYKLLK